MATVSMPRGLWAALFAAPLLLGSTADAEACTCVDSPLCQQIWQPGAEPPAYFIATVYAIEDAPGGMRRVRLRDVQSVHGATATAVVTSAHDDSCGYAFTVGERYFIDAVAHQDGSFSTTGCSKTTPLAQAAPFIDYLASLSRPATGGRIFGSVYSERPVVTMFDDYDRQPVAKLLVTLSGPVTRRSETRADGTFSFDGLPAGAYRLTAASPRGLTLVMPAEGASSAIALPNARACAETWLSFERPRR